ncbi:MAG: hypothetical protein L0214_08610 [candidate division NC10 bacterium]|nr:hypothetical protein [candidate division NC10 bacterium]
MKLGKVTNAAMLTARLGVDLLQAMVLIVQDVRTLREPPLAGGGERSRNRERTGSTAGGRR